jgi:hypothetical protein
VAQIPDAAANLPDLADAAAKGDLPLIAVPYLVVMVEDAAADVAADAQQAPGVDADRDAFSLPRDVGPDMSFPPPPYVIMPMVSGGPLGGAQGTPPGPLAPPEKK